MRGVVFPYHPQRSHQKALLTSWLFMTSCSLQFSMSQTPPHTSPLFLPLNHYHPVLQGVKVQLRYKTWLVCAPCESSHALNRTQVQLCLALFIVSVCLRHQQLEPLALETCCLLVSHDRDITVWTSVSPQLCWSCSSGCRSTNGLWSSEIWNYCENHFGTGIFSWLLWSSYMKKLSLTVSKGQTGEATMLSSTSGGLTRKCDCSSEWCIIHCSPKVKLSCICSWMWNTDCNYEVNFSLHLSWSSL